MQTKQQIKIFKGIESELTELENRVNNWIKGANVRVAQIFGNIAPQSFSHQDPSSMGRGYTPSDVLVIVVFEAA